MTDLAGGNQPAREAALNCQSSQLDQKSRWGTGGPHSPVSGRYSAWAPVGVAEENTSP